MKWMRLSAALVAGILACMGAPAKADLPDARGEIYVEEPTYKGVRASAPIPKRLHVKNEGGRDGAGLCVISSVLANGRYQGVPKLGEYNKHAPIGEGGKDSMLWRLAKSRPGGYSPDKLKDLVAQALPGEKYASIVGRGTQEEFSLLAKINKAGYPLGLTMNTGRLYNYRPIHHMVSWPHFRTSGWSCFVDNNQPGVFSWIPSSEAMRRAVDGGTFWAWTWTRKPPQPGDPATFATSVAGIVGGMYLLFALAGGRKED